MGYLEQLKTFSNTSKVFTVKFYKEYEDDNGYWDAFDNWVEGDIKEDIVYEKSFLTLEKALEFADKTQENILKEEQERYNNISKTPMTLYWFSTYMLQPYSFITAFINWGGSEYRMKITYKVIEK